MYEIASLLRSRHFNSDRRQSLSGRPTWRRKAFKVQDLHAGREDIGAYVALVCYEDKSTACNTAPGRWPLTEAQRRTGEDCHRPQEPFKPTR